MLHAHRTILAALLSLGFVIGGTIGAEENADANPYAWKPLVSGSGHPGALSSTGSTGNGYHYSGYTQQLNGGYAYYGYAYSPYHTYGSSLLPSSYSGYSYYPYGQYPYSNYRPGGGYFYDDFLNTNQLYSYDASSGKYTAVDTGTSLFSSTYYPYQYTAGHNGRGYGPTGVVSAPPYRVNTGFESANPVGLSNFGIVDAAGNYLFSGDGYASLNARGYDSSGRKVAPAKVVYRDLTGSFAQLGSNAASNSVFVQNSGGSTLSTRDFLGSAYGGMFSPAGFNWPMPTWGSGARYTPAYSNTNYYYHNNLGYYPSGSSYNFGIFRGGSNTSFGLGFSQYGLYGSFQKTGKNYSFGFTFR